MNVTLNFDKYEEMGGAANEETFEALYNEAVAYVSYLVGHKTPTTEQQADVDRAVAICINKFAEYGVENTGGFSLGSFSMSANANGVAGGRDYAREAVVYALSGTGLLYAGVC